MTTAMKVGALAMRTGLTVRTLHYYDEIGLLTPSARSPAGHRLYDDDDLSRLQVIASLKYLGMPLEEIKECISRPEYSLEQTLSRQIERVREDISRQQVLLDLLLRLTVRLSSGAAASIDEITRTIEVTMNYDKYYSPEQQEQLKRRHDEVGEERVQKGQQEWTELFAAYQQAMDKGLDPASDETKALARRSAALIEEFTGGDPGIRQSLNNMYEGEGAEAMMDGHGMQMAPGLWEYMTKASLALKEDGS